jgi:hypothetical protein
MRGVLHCKNYTYLNSSPSLIFALLVKIGNFLIELFFSVLFYAIILKLL